jgi:fatty-acyl-CoA synthase
MSHPPETLLGPENYRGGLNSGLGSWPWRRARITPQRRALEQNGTTLTYRELAMRTATLAASMIEAGLAPGERVAYLGPNAISAFESLFATGLAGGVFVPLNTRLAPREIAYMLADSGAAILIVAPTHYDVITAIGALPPTVRLVLALQSPGCPFAHADYQQFLAAGTPAGFPAVALDDPALILYTSGTTGTPKGAVLTHGNVTFNTINQLAHFDVTSTDRALCLAPLFHVTGLGQITLPTLFKGGCVQPVARFDPAEVLATIESDRITSFSAVPTILQMLAEHPHWADTDLSSLHTIVYGGSPVLERVAREWLRRGVSLLQGYGMTEAAAGVYLATGDTAAGHPTSVGVPHFFTDVAMLGPVAADPPQPGDSAELGIRGPHVFAGYWNRAQDTADAFTDTGWFRTGDVVATGHDGQATIVDRVKDIIISGGENIYPAEVEAALDHVPGVASAAVIGVADPKWGEVGVAYIVADPDNGFDEERTRELLSTHLAHYKIPKHFRIVDSIPRNATGKILRAQLRQAELDDTPTAATHTR